MPPKLRSDPGFPRDLLAKPVDARLAYFKAHMIRHPHFRKALGDLLFRILYQGAGTLLYLMGPTGGGKSELLNQAQRLLVAIKRNELRHDLSRVPFGIFNAWKVERGNYDWFQHYRNTLMALDEVLIDLKLPIPIEEWQRSHQGKVPPKRALGRDLRNAVLQAFKNKRPYAMFIDEAQRIASVASGRKFEDEFDVLKGLAKDGTIQTTHVLTGTHELLQLARLSGQNGRISREVYLLPYRRDNPDEFKTFITIVLHFQRHLPLPKTPDLKSLTKFLHEGSLGLTGLLKDWLNDTFTDVLVRKHGTTITREDLERNALPEEKLSIISKEIRKFDKIRTELDRAVNRNQVPGTPDVHANNERPSAPKSQPRRVGRRNPKRDRVGDQSEVEAA